MDQGFDDNKGGGTVWLVAEVRASSCASVALPVSMPPPVPCPISATRCQVPGHTQHDMLRIARQHVFKAVIVAGFSINAAGIRQLPAHWIGDPISSDFIRYHRSDDPMR